jgi:hypothetical protein
MQKCSPCYNWLLREKSAMDSLLQVRLTARSHDWIVEGRVGRKGKAYERAHEIISQLYLHKALDAEEALVRNESGMSPHRSGQL